MRATHAIGGAVMTIVSSSSKEWERLTNSTFSFHGLHMAWDRPPSADAELDLDGEAMRFSAAKAFAVEFAADCNGARPCAQDGDTFETLLSVEAQSDATNLRSVVTVTTVMESLLSCDHSLVSVELDVVPIATPIRVQLFVNDVDSFPVRYTRVEINLIFGGRNIPVQWNRGSNEYVADVPAALTGQPGLYNLVLSASNAWNGSAGRVTSCELLRRTITVKEGLSTNWILVGAGTAAVVVVGALALVVRKRHAHLQAILTMLLTEMGMLVFSICTALANLVTDGIVFGRLLRDEVKVSSESYTAAYATILCFGVVATALSLGYRIRNARLMKAQLQQLALQGQAVAANSARHQSQQHEWERVQTHRTRVTLSLSLTSVAAQGVRAYASPALANMRRPVAVHCRFTDVDP
jgi:hypothetical protein